MHVLWELTGRGVTEKKSSYNLILKTNAKNL
jgi:hypothetical protein